MKYISTKRRLELFYKKNISKKPIKYFGHEFFFSLADQFNFNKGANLIEIGSERGAGSSLHLAKLAKKKGWNFITVDINEETSKHAEELVKKVEPRFQSVNEYGEKFLEKYTDSIDICYLDAFDVPGPWNSAERLAAYENRGDDLTMENCWKMHYDCCVSLVEKMPVGGMLVFDDVYPVDEQGQQITTSVEKKFRNWDGKGKTAIPLILDNGFELIHYRPNGAVFRRVSKS